MLSKFVRMSCQRVRANVCVCVCVCVDLDTRARAHAHTCQVLESYVTELVHRLKQTEKALSRRRNPRNPGDFTPGSYNSKQPCTHMHGHTKHLRASTSAGHGDCDMT